MNIDEKLELYRQTVRNKYQIYNSLFLTLPYEKMTDIGVFLPYLYEHSRTGLEDGKSPTEVVEEFFQTHFPDGLSENARIDLLFRIVQYVERQVVLFDSIEDAAFSELFPAATWGTISHFHQVAQDRDALQSVQQNLEEFIVKLVFTAHPTQFYSNNVQRIMQQLQKAIPQNDIQQIDILLQQLGLTSLVNIEKPTPLDEAESIIYYLRHVYYDAIGQLYSHVTNLFHLDSESQNSLFQLGFWPGGDRDGNPYVTAETTAQVVHSLHIAVLKSYYNHVKELRKKFTFKHVSEMFDELSNCLYDNMTEKSSNISMEYVLDILHRIREEVIQRNNSLHLPLLQDLIQRVHLFAMHFATLDIRQDSSVHNALIAALVTQYLQKDYENSSESEKIELLNQLPVIENPKLEDEIWQDTLDNIRQLQDLQARYGERSVHRYIISNSESQLDVLQLLTLFRICGYAEDEIHIDIIPLFETMTGMAQSATVMHQLYSHKAYARHLRSRNNRQTIMLGFSDGTKDGGYLKANWEIFKTKEALTAVSREHNHTVVFFDGRGGPPARGGGKTHQFYAAQGSTISNRSIELTIQGQTITSVFGTHAQATYNLEQLLTAGLKNQVFDSSSVAFSPEHRELMEQLSNWSHEAYTQLKNHPQFVPYLENLSTLRFYGSTNIGSRPAKRGNKKQLDLNDLRAIPFVGSWSLLKQNVPGYYGLGTALQRLKEADRWEEAKALFQESYFFKTLVQNSMMSLSKCYFPLTAYLSDDEQYGEFWKLVHQEFLRTKDLLLDLTGYEFLMQDEPVSRQSIQIREKIVLPLLVIQQHALHQIYTESEHTELYQKLVTRALFGNINASRNSA
ncbi:MAG: phosphoenolpyruvate carboxylase [Weeksellaceae bacterium]|nr:phosphoenolpyruvate carboxylase [Weeksellaceae bacterium]